MINFWKLKTRPYRCFTWLHADFWDVFHSFTSSRQKSCKTFHGFYIVSVTDREYTDWYSWAISICLQLIQLINVKLTQQFWSSEYHLNCIIVIFACVCFALSWHLPVKWEKVIRTLCHTFISIHILIASPFLVFRVTWKPSL